MKMHRPIYSACLTALKNIFVDSRHADKVVDISLRENRKWGARDRRVFAETVYDIVRWWRLLLVMSESEKMSPADAVAKVVEFYLAEKDQFRDKAAKFPLAVRESVPDWLAARLNREIGLERTSLMLSAMNETAPQFLRVNELKSTLEKAQERLSGEEIETATVANAPSALRLIKRKNVFRSKAFLDGFFEMQDAGSQLIAPFLNVEPGQFVIDACAGGGGKTLHLAALTKNQGRILALDVHERKLEELKKRARRAGASNIETRLIDSSKVIKRLAGKADRVLLDVPCSGLGVLRRMPDTKWKLTEAELERLAELQMNILVNYSEMVKPGGKLVYSTCSILPSENLFRVQEFVAHSGGRFHIEEQWQVSPIETQFDGFFACRLSRVDTSRTV